MEKLTRLTDNFIWGESWSSIRLARITFKRAVEPCTVFLDSINNTAENIQKVRNTLNEEYFYNRQVGTRNRKDEIIIRVNSWWRTKIFQDYLYTSGKSTVSISKHQTGIAIDIARVPGFTVRQLRDFIISECETDFTKIIEYKWGLHLDSR